MLVKCPHCSQDVNVASSTDKPMLCPHCRGVFHVAPPSAELPFIPKKKGGGNFRLEDQQSDSALPPKSDDESSFGRLQHRRKRNLGAPPVGMVVLGIIVMGLSAIFTMLVFFTRNMNSRGDGSIIESLMGVGGLLIGAVFITGGCIIRALYQTRE